MHEKDRNVGRCRGGSGHDRRRPGGGGRGQAAEQGQDGAVMVFEPAFVKIAPGDTVKFVATDKGHNAGIDQGHAARGRRAVPRQEQRRRRRQVRPGRRLRRQVPASLWHGDGGDDRGRKPRAMSIRPRRCRRSARPSRCLRRCSTSSKPARPPRNSAPITFAVSRMDERPSSIPILCRLASAREFQRLEAGHVERDRLRGCNRPGASAIVRA